MRDAMLPSTHVPAIEDGEDAHFFVWRPARSATKARRPARSRPRATRRGDARLGPRFFFWQHPGATRMAVNGKHGLRKTRGFEPKRAQPVQGSGPTTTRRTAGWVVCITKNTLRRASPETGRVVRSPGSPRRTPVARRRPTIGLRNPNQIKSVSLSCPGLAPPTEPWWTCAAPARPRASARREPSPAGSPRSRPSSTRCAPKRASSAS